MPVEDAPDTPPIIDVQLQSNLSFAAESMPADGAAMYELALGFAEPFGEELKKRTGAVSAQHVEIVGTKGESGNVFIAFKLNYVDTQSALFARDYFTQLRPVAEQIADELWRRQLGARLTVVDSSVWMKDSIATEPAQISPAPLAVADAPIQAAENPSRRPFHFAALALAAAIGCLMGFGGSLFLSQKDTESTSEKLAAIEASLAKLEEQARQPAPTPNQTISVICPPQKAAAPQPAESSRRWSTY